MKEKIKSLFLADLAIGMVVASWMWMDSGTEGMAKMFCNSFPVETCEEIDWSDGDE